MRVPAEPRILKRPQNVNQCALFIKREIPIAWMLILFWCVLQVCVFMGQEELIMVLYLALLIVSYQFTLLSHRALHQSVK